MLPMTKKEYNEELAKIRKTYDDTRFGLHDPGPLSTYARACTALDARRDASNTIPVPANKMERLVAVIESLDSCIARTKLLTDRLDSFTRSAAHGP
jgi:hypothetical protein